MVIVIDYFKGWNTLCWTQKWKILCIEKCLFEQLIKETENNKQMKQSNVVSDLYMDYITILWKDD